MIGGALTDLVQSILAVAEAIKIAFGSGAVTLGYAENRSTFGFTTIADVTGLSTTVDIPNGGRRIEIEVFVPSSYSSVNNDAIDVTIYEGANRISQITSTLGGIGGNSNTFIVCKAVFIPSAGSHTYKVRAERVFGSGSCALAANGTAAMYIHVKAV